MLSAYLHSVLGQAVATTHAICVVLRGLDKLRWLSRMPLAAFTTGKLFQWAACFNHRMH
jgi:hypothetical protein